MCLLIGGDGVIDKARLSAGRPKNRGSVFACIWDFSIPLTFQTASEIHPVSSFWEQKLFLRGLVGRGFQPNTPLQLLMRLRMSGFRHILPPYTFIACTGITIRFKAGSFPLTSETRYCFSITCETDLSVLIC